MNRTRSGGPANVGSVNVYFGPMGAAEGRLDPTRSNTRFVLAGGRSSGRPKAALVVSSASQSSLVNNIGTTIKLYIYIYIYIYDV